MDVKMQMDTSEITPAHQFEPQKRFANGSVSEHSPRITFENFLGQGRVNQLGGVFINGRPLPHEKRVQIVEMARRGIKPCKISRELKVSHGAVSKILNRFHETGSISPGQIGGNPRSRLSIQAVRQHILRFREENPSLSGAQIQQMLVQRGICSRQNVPSSSRINRLLKAQRTRNGGATQNYGEKRKISTQHQAGAGKAQRPLSHSIENILWGAGANKNAGVAEKRQPENGTQNKGAFPPNFPVASSSASSASPPFCSSSSASSSSSSSASMLGAQAQIAPGSDEENQHNHQRHQPPAGISLLQFDGRRARTSFSAEQLRLLERTFAKSPYPDQQQKEWLIEATKLDEDKIITWFSNRRARNRRKFQQQHPSPHQLLAFSSACSGTDQMVQSPHPPVSSIFPATISPPDPLPQLDSSPKIGNQAMAPPSIPLFPALFPFPFPALHHLAPAPAFGQVGILPNHRFAPNEADRIDGTNRG